MVDELRKQARKTVKVLCGAETPYYVPIDDDGRISIRDIANNFKLQDTSLQVLFEGAQPVALPPDNSGKSKNRSPFQPGDVLNISGTPAAVSEYGKEKAAAATPFESAEAFEQFFLNHDGRRNNVEKPHKLARNTFNWQAIGRDQALHATYAYFAKRLWCWRTLDMHNRGSKENHPIGALAAAPGSGKSFFLDLLADLQGQHVDDNCKQKDEKEAELPWDDLRDMLKNQTLPICITYNAATPMSDVEEKNTGLTEKGLILRVLWAALLDIEKVPWRDIIHVLPRIPLSYTFSRAMAFLSEATPYPNVLLCIDEILKLTIGREKILTAIGACLAQTPTLMVMITTLDADPLLKFEAQSGRPICWIKLGLIPTKEACEVLFKDYLDRSTPEKRKELLLCVSDCNGHGRSLEALGMTLHQDASGDTIPSYSVVMTNTAKQLPGALTPTEEQVRYALKGLEQIGVLQMIGDESFKDLVAAGIYLNVDLDIYAAVPRLSFLRLRKFTQVHHPVSKDDRPCNISYCLHEIFEVETNFSPAVLYEQFHAWHEVLKTLLHADLTSLQKLYGLDTAIGPNLHAPRFWRVRELAHQFPPPGPVIEQVTGAEIIHLERYVLRPAARNPGFDLVLMLRKSDDTTGYIAVCIDCRYSAAESRTELSETDIKDKLRLTQKSWKPFVKDGDRPGIYYGNETSRIGKLKMDMKDVYLVIVAFRDDDKWKQVDKQKNLIILDKDHLSRLYSPSLATRPQFIAWTSGDKDEASTVDPSQQGSNFTDRGGVKRPLELKTKTKKESKEPLNKKPKKGV